MARRVLPRGVADLSAAVVRDGRGIAAEPGARPNPTGSSTNCRAPPSRSAAAPLEAAAAQSTAGHLLDFRSPQVARRPACSTRYNNPPAHTNVPGRRGCDAMHFAMSRLDLRHCPQRPNPGNEKGSFFFFNEGDGENQGSAPEKAWHPVVASATFRRQPSRRYSNGNTARRPRLGPTRLGRKRRCHREPPT